MKFATESIAVIGCGFYGASVAEHLARQGARVTVIEQDPEPLMRASYNNQARLHGGYHYPRSFSTAYRSRLNFPRFMEQFHPAIRSDFVNLYAIARINTKVTARQFETFCRNIEAPLRPARPAFAKMFAPHLIEAVYETEEFVFDAAILRRLMADRLQNMGVEMIFGRRVSSVETQNDSRLRVVCTDGSSLSANWVFNCTYAGLNTIGGISRTRQGLKQEVTEMALVELPPELQGLSVTVMDGPFFSFMPFPDRNLATLSHVRYTPHADWIEKIHGFRDPYATLDVTSRETRFGYMIRDAQRYLPALRGAVYRDSLFEIKTVLMRNESDDGRPILFEADPRNPHIVSMLGSKIDNIYDALAAIDLIVQSRPRA